MQPQGCQAVSKERQDSGLHEASEPGNPISMVKRNPNSPSGEPKIHNRIAVLRAERNLSRQTLALILGINYQTVGYLERGDYTPSLDLAFKLAEYFQLPIEAIFSRTPFEPLSQQVYQK